MTLPAPAFGGGKRPVGGGKQHRRRLESHLVPDGDHVHPRRLGVLAVQTRQSRRRKIPGGRARSRQSERRLWNSGASFEHSRQPIRDGPSADTPMLGSASSTRSTAIPKTVRITGDLTWVKGKHTLKFGGGTIRSQNNIFNISREVGQYSFNARYTKDGVGDMLLGWANVYQVVDPASGATASVASFGLCPGRLEDHASPDFESWAPLRTDAFPGRTCTTAWGTLTSSPIRTIRCSFPPVREERPT